MTTFSSSYTVYYEDTDAAGVVYYANYLKFAERARTDALTSLGIDQQKMLRDDGLCFVVSRVEIDYKRPAVLGDKVTASVHVTQLGKSRVCMEQHLMRDSETLSTLQVTVALIDMSGKPKRMPESLAQTLKKLMNEEPF